MRNDFGTRPYKSRFPYKAGKKKGGSVKKCASLSKGKYIVVFDRYKYFELLKTLIKVFSNSDTKFINNY